MNKNCENCVNLWKKENYKFYAHCLYYNFPIRKNEVSQFKNCEEWNNLRD